MLRSVKQTVTGQMDRQARPDERLRQTDRRRTQRVENSAERLFHTHRPLRRDPDSDLHRIKTLPQTGCREIFPGAKRDHI